MWWSTPTAGARGFLWVCSSLRAPSTSAGFRSTTNAVDSSSVRGRMTAAASTWRCLADRTDQWVSIHTSRAENGSWSVSMEQRCYIGPIYNVFGVDTNNEVFTNLLGHRDSSMRSHHAGAASIALAFCSSSSWLQGCMSGAPAVSGSDTCLPGWRRPTRDGHWSPSSAFSGRQDMLACSTDAQQFRRSKLQCGRPACVEQRATARQDMSFARFQHKLKTFLFGC